MIVHHYFGIILVLVLLTVQTGCQGGSGNETSSSTEDSKSEYALATDFTLDVVGSEERITLSDHEGEVVLLNFWATWCGPCMLEMPLLIDLQEGFGSRGFKVIGISVDEGGEQVVDPFVNDFGFNYPVVVDEGELAASYGAQYAVPTTVLIGRDRRVRYRILGLVEKSELQALVEELLNET